MKLHPRTLLFIYLAVLLAGTVAPLNRANSILSNNYTLHIRWDYIVHFLLYLPLPLLLKHSFAGTDSKRKWLATVGLSVLISAGFEFLQMVIPYRFFNVNDMLGNMGGVLLGFLVILVFQSSENSFRRFR